MKIRNRILSVILALVLCVGMLPISTMTAFAAVVANGDCGTEGNNVTWSYDNSTKTLTISGTGAMADYPSDSDDHSTAPWKDYITDINTVDIKYGVTQIGSYAFYGCTALNSVTIPDSVTTILAAAFEKCSSLQKITIPNSITRITSGLFQSSGLTEVVIPHGVTSIGMTSFYNCSSLTKVTIPITVTQIERYAFYNCDSLNNVVYAGSQSQWNSIELPEGNDKLKNATRTYGAVDITFNTDGGSAVDSVVVTKGGTLSTLPTTTKANFKFDGWFTEKTGSTKVTESTQFSENKTIYAHWTPTTVPTAADFDFTPPTNLVYDGTAKEATVTVKDSITGMGVITVKYEPMGATYVGTYIVKIDVAEGTAYAAANDITDASWTFTIRPTIPVNPTTPTSSGITYGQTLADSTLTAGWVWAEPATVPTVTNSGYTAYYTVDDTNFDWSAVDGYNKTEHRLERTVQITVAKTTPTVDPKPTASRVIIGGKLSDSTLTGGVASVPGTFAWKDGTEVLDTAETVTRKVVFTPDDTDNYNTVELDVDVTVVVCDTTSGEHDFSELKHSDTEHWMECSVCHVEKPDSREAHKGGTATCTAKAKCSVCSEEYGKANGHGETEIKNDKPASCKEEGYTGDKHCKVCGEKLENGTAIAKTAHTYENGKCTVCGAADPNYKVDSPQTGDNSNMTLWIALLFVSCMGLIATTVYGRKKRRTN